MFFPLFSVPGEGDQREPIGDELRPDFQADALAVGYKSSLLTSGGALLGRYLLMVQRDEYPALIDRTPPVTNVIIDECWQRVFTFHAAAGGESGAVFFAEQSGSNRQFLAYAPLFFCRHQRRFFHPPCPRCGKALLLCRDDRLLAESGLPYYSRSLNRYLYCPDCRPSAGAFWYAKRRYGEDQQVVQEAADLIRDFGKLPEGVDPSLQVPCPGCPHHQECYGASGQAVNHIRIVSFYPFYLLVTEDHDCHGGDFSARLAGASAEQLVAEKNARGQGAGSGQASRVIDGRRFDDFLYPADDQCRFLELLYLKVRLLDAVAQDIVNGRLAETFPGYFLTPADIGISFVAGSTLPNYWAFRLTYPGVERYLMERFRLPGNALSGQLCRYGFFWFFLLVSNSKQQETMLFDKLSRLLEHGAAAARLSVLDDAFHPRQAWWDPPASFGTPWQEQWDTVLSAGLELLSRGYRQPDAALDQACSAAGTCLADLRSFVLSSSPERKEQPQAPNAGADRDIYKIVTAIKTSWQQRSDRLQGGTDWSADEKREEIFGHTRTTGPDGDRSSDLEETVVIPSNNLSREPLADDTLPAQRRAGARVTGETAPGLDISGMGAAADVPAPPQRLTPEHDRSEIEETLIIGKSGITGRHEERAPPSELRRGLLDNQARDRSGDLGGDPQPVADFPGPPGDRFPAGGGPLADEDELEETVRLARSPFAQDPADRPVERKREPPANGSPDPVKTGHHAGEDDFLTETVVLKPKKSG